MAQQRPSKPPASSGRAPSPDKQDIEEYTEVFALFDRDGDGFIDHSELGTCMRALGRNPTQGDLQRIVAEREERGKNLMDFADFLTLMVRNDPGSPDEESEILDAFQVFDQTGSGTISVAELRHVMSNLGEKLTEDEMDDMMREFNIFSDGTIDYREFIRNLIRS